MNTETQPTTAAELLAEWKELLDYNHHLRNDREDRFASLKECKNSERMDVVAARLDEMCEDAGISIIDGRFWYDDFDCEVEEEDGTAVGLGKIAVCELPAREQQALQEWLLIKAQAQ